MQLINIFIGHLTYLKKYSFSNDGIAQMRIDMMANTLRELLLTFILSRLNYDKLKCSANIDVPVATHYNTII